MSAGDWDDYVQRRRRLPSGGRLSEASARNPATQVSFSVTVSGVGRASAVRNPRAPTYATGALRSAAPTAAIPPHATGCSIPNSSVKRVKRAFLPAAAVALARNRPTTRVSDAFTGGKFGFDQRPQDLLRCPAFRFDGYEHLRHCRQEGSEFELPQFRIEIGRRIRTLLRCSNLGPVGR